MDPDLLALADNHEPAVRESYRRLIRNIQGDYPPAAVAAAIREGDTAAVWGMLSELVETHRLRAGSQVETLMLDALNDARKKIYGDTPAAHHLSLNMRNRHAEEWAAAEAARLITSITPTQREEIRRLIASVPEEPLRPDEVARQLRAHIGLLPAHRRAVDNYRWLLWGRAKKLSGYELRVDMPPTLEREFEEEINDWVDTYARRLLNWRADMIARTESMRATNIGQILLWIEQEEKGFVDRQAGVKWVVTDDDRLCPLCAPMDGQVVPLSRLRAASKLHTWDKLVGSDRWVDPSTRGFVSRKKGFFGGVPRPGRQRVLRPDPISQRKRPITAGSANLLNRKRRHYVFSPPLHPQCRCRVVLIPDPEDAAKANRDYETKLTTERVQSDIRRRDQRLRQEAKERERLLRNRRTLHPLEFPPDIKTKTARRAWLVEQFQKLGVPHASFNGSDPEAILQVLNAIRAQWKWAGHTVMPRIRYIGDYYGKAGTGFRPYRDWRWGSNTWAHARNYHTHTFLAVNPSWWKDEASFAATMRQVGQDGSRWHPGVGRIEEVIAHELGHHFSYLATSDAGLLRLGQDGPAFRDAYQAIYAALDRTTRTHISGYAATKISEGWAELFQVAVGQDDQLFAVEAGSEGWAELFQVAVGQVRKLVRQVRALVGFLEEGSLEQRIDSSGLPYFHDMNREEQAAWLDKHLGGADLWEGTSLFPRRR